MEGRGQRSSYFFKLTSCQSKEKFEGLQTLEPELSQSKNEFSNSENT